MQVTELIDNWQWRSLFIFDDCVIEQYWTDWLNYFVDFIWQVKSSFKN